jgi:hypothetical protein
MTVPQGDLESNQNFQIFAYLVNQFSAHTFSSAGNWIDEASLPKVCPLTVSASFCTQFMESRNLRPHSRFETKFDGTMYDTAHG